MGGRISWLSSDDAFSELAPAWADLARTAGPFHGPDWCAAWWRAFGAGRELALCCLHDGNELVGIYPLARRREALRSLSNSETPAFRPLARDDEALAELSTGVLSAAGTLEITSLPAHEAAHRMMHERAVAARALDTVVEQYRSPITDTTGGFAQYRAQRKDAWRETERRARKADREHDARFSLIEAVEDVQPVLEEGLALEASGWKGQAGTAILSSAATAGFYRDVAAFAAIRGELRFSTLRLDGHLVAFDLALLSNNRYFLLKTAYDEAVKRLSPGLVLRRAVIEACFESGLEAHEFLGIDMAWKQLFATGHRAHVRYRAYRPTPANRLRHVYRARIRPRGKRVLARYRAQFT